MTYKDEVKRLVLSHLLNKYAPGTPLTDRHWNLAYKVVRADNIIDTLNWKIQYMTVQPI